MTAPSQMHAPVKVCAPNWTNGKLLTGCCPARRGKTSALKNCNMTEAETPKGSNHPAENTAIRICFMGSMVGRTGARVVRKLFEKRQFFVLTVHTVMNLRLVFAWSVIQFSGIRSMRWNRPIRVAGNRASHVSTQCGANCCELRCPTHAASLGSLHLFGR